MILISNSTSFPSEGLVWICWQNWTRYSNSEDLDRWVRKSSNFWSDPEFGSQNQNLSPSNTSIWLCWKNRTKEFLDHWFRKFSWIFNSRFRFNLHNPNLTISKWQNWNIGIMILYCRLPIFRFELDWRLEVEFSLFRGSKLTLAEAFTYIPKEMYSESPIPKIQTDFGSDPDLGSNIQIWLLQTDQFVFVEKSEQIIGTGLFLRVCRWARKIQSKFWSGSKFVLLFLLPHLKGLIYHTRKTWTKYWNKGF